MGSITNSLEQDLLDHILNKVAYTNPATIYLCLCTADPTDAATGASMNEVANSFGYARTAIVFAAAGSRSIDQTGSVDFPQASGGGWSTVTHWCITDNGTYGAGQALAHGAFSPSKLINDGDTPSVATGEIDVTISAGEVSDYLANIILDFAFRDQAFASPATYVGFTTATIDDTDDGDTITEVSGGAYARLIVNEATGGAPEWDPATSADPSIVDNSDEIAFVTATADWTTVTSWFVATALTSGEVLFYDNDVTDKQVDNGDTAKFAADTLVMQCS